MNDSKSSSPKRIRFKASLPPIQSAISLDGHGDGARVKFDIPRNETGAVLLLQRFYSGKAFFITIEAIDDQ